MSTSGAIGFQLNNIIKATYNQFDSYPEALGYEIANFLSILNKQAFKRLKQRVGQLRWVPEVIKPTSTEIHRYKHFTDLSDGINSINNWYDLLIKVQDAKALPYILSGELKVLIDNTNFLQEALACEWVYIINFDNNTFDTSKRCAEARPNYAIKPVLSLPFECLVSGESWLEQVRTKLSKN